MKLRVEFFEMHYFTMLNAALCVTFHFSMVFVWASVKFEIDEIDFFIIIIIN